MDNKSFGTFIASKRRELGLTQLQLADTLGVTDRAVSKWERGISFPDIMLIPEIASLLGVDANDLLEVEQAQSLGLPKPQKDSPKTIAVKTLIALGLSLPIMTILLPGMAIGAGLGVWLLPLYLASRIPDTILPSWNLPAVSIVIFSSIQNAIVYWIYLYLKNRNRRIAQIVFRLYLGFIILCLALTVIIFIAWFITTRT